MEALLTLDPGHGALLIFLVVLVEQAGLPIPAYPALLLAGAVASRNGGQVLLPLAAAVLACLVSDAMWHLAGRRHGTRVLGLLCRIALNPEVCIARTQGAFLRWGAPSLLIAKFVPGFATLAMALAGAVRVPWLTFMLFDGVGALLWAASGLALGSLFADSIGEVLDVLAGLGSWGAVIVLLGLAVFLLQRWWRREVWTRTTRPRP